MTQFKVLKPLRVLNTELGGDGLVHHPGDVIEISNERATELTQKVGEGFIKEIKKEKMTLSDRNITQLREFADANSLEIPEGVTRKADILAFILEATEE